MGFLTALTRRRLLGGASALSLLPAAPVRAHSPSAPLPREEHVLDLIADVAPGSGGWQPISGGRFEGPRLSGDVLPGGTLNVSTRHDGIHVLELDCALRTGAGQHLSLRARALVDPEAANPAELRAVPEVDAPAGAHDWLNRALLVASLDAAQRAAGRVALRIHRLV